MELTTSFVSIEVSAYETELQANAFGGDQCSGTTEYSYPDASATDSHNGAVDVCERVWYSSGYGEELCCTPDERSGMIDGCDAFGYGDQAPQLCDASYETTCSGIDTSIVSTWEIQYTAMDYSENTAEPVDVIVVIYDEEIPECPELSDGMYYDVEKCTYFDVPDLDCFDCVDGFLEATPSIAYHGEGYAPSGCIGGSWSSEVDVDTPGYYTIEYTVSDTSGNDAVPVCVTVNVQDTTPPFIGLDIPETTLECSNCGGVTCADADPIASTNNLPCLDYPEANDDCEDNFDATFVNDFTVDWTTNDGYNDASTTQSITIVDTTPPTITCPGTVEYNVHEEVHCEGDTCISTRDDTCDNGDNPSDNSGDCDTDHIGTYIITYNAEDDSGNSASCIQECIVVDEECPVCTLNGLTEVTLEACQEDYEEDGFECVDNYRGNGAIVTQTTTTYLDAYGAEVTFPAYEGTFYIEYDACDQSNNCAATLTRTITVTDTTAPVVTTNGDLIYAEASVLDVATGASATDECCSYLTSSFEATAIDFSHCGSFQYGITSEYWFNVYGDSATEFIYYCGESYDDAAAAADAATSSQDDNNLAAACAAYTVDWFFTDCAADANTGTASQTVWTIDTIQPSISGVGAYFAVAQAAQGNAGALALVAGVALFAGLVVGRKTGQRSAYMPL